MRALLVINARLDKQVDHAVNAGRSPRRDYLELQRALQADTIDLGTVEQCGWARVIQRFLGTGVAQGLLTWTRCSRYDSVFVDRETSGFVFGALVGMGRRRPRIAMIGHFLSPWRKRALFRVLHLRHAIDCVIVHSSRQQHIARDSLGMRSDQVALVPYQCDQWFWSSQGVPTKTQICSVGLEYRDYDALVEAVDGLDIDVVIAAASHWSKHHSHVDAASRVRVTSFDYEELRQCYAESLFVVVPLRDVENQAGITVILEAMAMGKAVIVSHTRGQMDVVRDRRRLNRSDPNRLTQPDWVRRLGASEEIAQGQTGIYVLPGDARELRRAIAFLLRHPDQARIMGANGRRVIEATMSLDHYTDRLAAIIRGEQWSDGVIAISSQPMHQVPTKA